MPIKGFPGPFKRQRVNAIFTQGSNLLLNFLRNAVRVLGLPGEDAGASGLGPGPQLPGQADAGGVRPAAGGGLHDDQALRGIYGPGDPGVRGENGAQWD